MLQTNGQIAYAGNIALCSNYTHAMSYQKNMARKILIDYQNSFAVTLSRKFATKTVRLSWWV